jgi:hypothetical protein
MWTCIPRSAKNWFREASRREHWSKGRLSDELHEMYYFYYEQWMDDAENRYADEQRGLEVE